MIKSFSILIILVFAFSIHPFRGWGQDVPPTTEQQLENQAEIDQRETEDDSYVQQLEHFKRHQLNLNEADANELKELVFLSDLQIDNLISYRDLLGKLISVYELQSIPAWDVMTIKRILPYINVGNAMSFREDIHDRFNSGENGLLLRYALILERSRGFDESAGKKYLGGTGKIFFRYKYQYKNVLQYGIAGDKDAGEQFLKGSQKLGFDFYSFHLFAREVGKIKALALGDFTVNLGQGLIQWQSLAFKKSSDVLAIKRQSVILRPYNSSGEFYFHRGAGVTVQLGRIEVTAYASLRRLSANIDADTIRGRQFISSFLNSGYHRTQSENDDRNNVRQISFGGNLAYISKNGHIGINGVSYDFSLPLQKKGEPYNLFSISGKSWSNMSLDYSYTFHNMHFFGEAAVDKNLNKAFLNGLVISVDPAIDLSFLHRRISPSYEAVYGNAFTENSNVTNEHGFFAGVSIRPLSGWRLDMYADMYSFPWLKYLVDAPSFGRDFSAQLSYVPDKHLEIHTRYRNESKQSNQSDDSSVTNYLSLIPKQSWRTQINYKINASITIRNRMELLWYNKNINTMDAFQRHINEKNGFLTYFDIIYKPSLKPYSGIIRFQYFETNGYSSRIYAYENDVLYNYSIPAFFDKGYRYYIDLSYALKKAFLFWIRWAQTIFPDKTSIASGLDEVNGNHRSEIKVQVQWLF